ncbi:Uncharacterized conserved protein, DUF2141 family [Duganella sp. CF517]|uniref:DUF2141 domain-containing protein n=1 Tax=Duganella sp. CF517 TaxID=1881038 RepID=UPI0008D8C86B|nr:DUF2141 domain-containing protein [Duganella sp. CF517]SEO38856.1 Uncharacterized conserved protein, DUF2141 family [Duganella sp. CF517]
MHSLIKPSLLISTFLLAATVSAATIEVKVSSVVGGRGKVNVAVCDKERFLKDCLYSGSAPAQAGETVVTIQNVPKGTWAVLAYQDENQNDKLDRNLIGIPSENYGFSRDARGKFGPPDFSDAAIDVRDDAMAVTIKLR